MKTELEEAAERLYPTPTPYVSGIDIGNSMKRAAFIKGAKWQQERMYTEEDMIKFAKYCNLKDDLSVRELLTIWFDQYKKK